MAMMQPINSPEQRAAAWARAKKNLEDARYRLQQAQDDYNAALVAEGEAWAEVLKLREPSDG